MNRKDDMRISTKAVPDLQWTCLEIYRQAESFFPASTWSIKTDQFPGAFAETSFLQEIRSAVAATSSEGVMQGRIVRSR
jgi:hypothetical protein